MLVVVSQQCNYGNGDKPRGFTMENKLSLTKQGNVWVGWKTPRSFVGLKGTKAHNLAWLFPHECILHIY